MIRALVRARPRRSDVLFGLALAALGFSAGPASLAEASSFTAEEPKQEAEPSHEKIDTGESPTVLSRRVSLAFEQAFLPNGPSRQRLIVLGTYVFGAKRDWWLGAEVPFA
ncbi:MAG: hypothetical protein ACRD3M_18770, partial [Thermoanaerobaculia bacterium]